MYDTIKQQIKAAAADRSKSATFHLLVLLNAKQLANEDPKKFAEEVGMTENYATEFRKMLKVAQLMEKRGIKLIQPENENGA
jgi:hypothetical protein